MMRERISAALCAAALSIKTRRQLVVGSRERYSVLPVTFKVSYRLAEYVQFWRGQFVTEAQAEMARRHKPVTRHVGLIALGLALLVAPPVFFYKVRKVGECHFTLDSMTISRVSKAGTLTYTWSKVVAIRQYRPGYVIATSSGAMPIPYRVLNEEQALEVAKLIAAWEQGQTRET